MSFLSLGLHNDEPPISPDQEGRKEAPRNGAAGPNGDVSRKDDLRATPNVNVNGNGSANLPATPAETPDKDVQSTRTASLPPSVEMLRRKLAEEEKLREIKRRPSPLIASVNSLSSSERQWVPSFSTFKFGYLPGRGLLYSTIGHEVAVFGLFLLFTYGLPMLHPQKLIDQNNSQDHLIYLPEVGGGTEGQKSPGAGQSAPQETSAEPAHASKGFAYPGKQAILSNPPNPTNLFQTVQRPLLVHPEPIRKLVPLPNIVQMAETRLPSSLTSPKVALPHLKEVPKPIRVNQDLSTHRDAEFQVPVNDAPELTAKLDMPKLPAAEEPVPEMAKPAPKPIKVTAETLPARRGPEVTPPSEAQIARMEMHGKAKEPLLSLSPMPLPNGPNVKIPNGEARGKFAIAPGGTLNPTSITPGKTNATPSVTPGTGQENPSARDAAGTDVASNAGSATGHGSANGGAEHTGVAAGSGNTGSTQGSGNTSGAGTNGTGTGKGRGVSGEGAGRTGGRNGSGTGSGAGSGSGTGAFPGITIQGGEDVNASSQPRTFTVAPQASYGMTVISTASSGGGLEDIGVFKNERVFTVYIPVKPNPDEEDPTWTLQYAVLESDPAVDEPESQQVIAPTVASAEWPQIPADLERRYAQRQVLIYAIISKEGKVTDISVKRTPDPRMSDPIAEALKKWLFHPALVNNQPAPVKILLGIPLG